MSQYPEAIATFREIQNIPGQAYDENKKTTLYTEDIQALRDEVAAIEETLGTNPLSVGSLFIASVVNILYPVGTIYTSVTSTSPSTLFGYGDWIPYGQGRVLVGYHSSDPDFDTVNETGGEKAHTLTVSEMPSHRHAVRGDSRADSVGITYSSNGGTTTNMRPASGSPNAATYTGRLYGWYEGSDEAHNNLQPYIVVYMWRRNA